MLPDAAAMAMARNIHLAAALASAALIVTPVAVGAVVVTTSLGDIQ